MFTGIVEEQGRVARVDEEVLRIEADTVLGDASRGDRQPPRRGSRP